MARAETNKLYRTFVKGLITEASMLTYPEDSTSDEDNCIIYRKGNRTRRLGCDLEESYQKSTHTVPKAQANDSAIQEFTWGFVANLNEISFLVQQIGLTLYFYDLSATPLSSGLKSFQIDLSQFAVAGVTGHSSCQVSMTSGKGYLFVVGEKFEPFYVEYDKATDSITTTQIYILIRDFIGVNDNLANDEEPKTLSSEHYYNLKNQGWLAPANNGTGQEIVYYNSFGERKTVRSGADDPIIDYVNLLNRYPPNNKQWWIAKRTDGNFNPLLLTQFYFGNTRAARGHFTVNAFNIDRSEVSGVASLPVEVTLERPSSVAFFSGRVWYSWSSRVAYSQILNDITKAGFCYQEADPTSEDISDLIASDGGFIELPDMSKARKLVSTGSGIMVFASNGVWFISGGQGGFTAVDISISKVSPIGTDSPNSIVETGDGKIFWWSKIGIMAFKQEIGMFGPIEGNFSSTNLTEDTIQTFYNDSISEEAKIYTKGIYDPASNTVQWLFKDSSLTSYNYLYNRVLIFDISLGAFYPWTVSTNGPVICGVFKTQKLNQTPTSSVVLSNNGSTLKSILNDTIVVREYNPQVKDTFLRYSCVVPNEPSIVNYAFSFCDFLNTDYCDWQRYDGVGVAYTSFAETGHELLEDAMRKKQTPHVFTYFRKTEDSFVPDGQGGFEGDNLSSCKLRTKWDWANSPYSGKFSREIEAYRHKRYPYFSGDNLEFDTGYPIVVTKHKVRGSGKAVQFRFECSEIRRNFDLLGWAVSYGGNTKV